MASTKEMQRRAKMQKQASLVRNALKNSNGWEYEITVKLPSNDLHYQWFMGNQTDYHATNSRAEELMGHSPISGKVSCDLERLVHCSSLTAQAMANGAHTQSKQKFFSYASDLLAGNAVKIDASARGIEIMMTAVPTNAHEPGVDKYVVGFNKDSYIRIKDITGAVIQDFSVNSLEPA